MRLAILLAALALGACSSSNKPAEPSPAKPSPAKITLFYPNQNIVARGEKVLICYGVENAVSVTIDPPVEQLKPSYNRCFDVLPQKSGKYTLRATGKDGSTVEKSFEIRLEGTARTPTQRSAGQLIHFFVANKNEVRPGEQVMLCYEVSNASDVTLTPDPHVPLARPKGCVQVSPNADTTYKLKVQGANGVTEEDDVKVRVRP